MVHRIYLNWIKQECGSFRSRCGRFTISPFDQSQNGFVLADSDTDTVSVSQSIDLAKRKACLVVRGETEASEHKRLKFQDMRVCNCADCGRMLLGLHHAVWWTQQTAEERAKYPPLLAGRIADRPYCASCLAEEQKWTPKRSAV